VVVSIFKICLVFVLSVNFTHGAFAAVINNAPGKMTDSFIAIGEKIAEEGVIWASVFEGRLAIEAKFTTKLTPDAVLGMYSSFLQSEIERFSNTEPVWKWMGDIDGEEKHLTVTYIPQGRITIIELVSYKNEPYKGHSPFGPYSFLKDMQDNLITSKETYSGEHSSGLFVYQYNGPPVAAVRYVSSRLESHRWESQLGQEYISQDDWVYNLMKKGSDSVNIVAAKDDDGSTTLTLIFRKTKS
jgi:hypothetical protein